MGVASDVADVPTWLAARFFDAVRRQSPRRVLDVGCGAGRLLRQCAAAGIQAHGVETDPAKVETLQAEGLRASTAPAEQLPFGDGSFDWVTLRHVCHHLAADAPALAEAFRVASTGIVVAEPWLDLDEPSHRVARRFDAWLEQQEERTGGLHRLPRRPAELLRALPSDIAEPELELWMLPRRRPPGWLDEQAAPFQPLPADAATELAEIRAAAAHDGIGYNGTCILVCRRSNHA